MLEIFLIYKLVSTIGRMLREKGRKAGGYQFLAVVLWIGGEILGATIGAMLGLEDPGIYGLSLLGAASGAGISYLLAAKADPALALGTELDRVFE